MIAGSQRGVGLAVVGGLVEVELERHVAPFAVLDPFLHFDRIGDREIHVDRLQHAGEERGLDRRLAAVAGRGRGDLRTQRRGAERDDEAKSEQNDRTFDQKGLLRFISMSPTLIVWILSRLDALLRFARFLHPRLVERGMLHALAAVDRHSCKRRESCRPFPG